MAKNRSFYRSKIGGTEGRIDLPKEVLKLGKIARLLKPEEVVERAEALKKPLPA